MTAHFDPTLAHDPERDVRDWSWWVTKVKSRPDGCAFILVAPRRAGKTWALLALQSSTGGTYIHLQTDGEDAWFNNIDQVSPVLVDEAGGILRREPTSFLRRCRDLKRAGKHVFVAMTPNEYSMLMAADAHGRFVSPKDVLFLKPLKVAEARALAGGEAWAEAIVEQVPEAWRRNAYLLTCVLFAGAEREELRGDLLGLLSYAVGVAAERQYIQTVLYEGLSSGQRNAIRALFGQATTRLPQDVEVLQSCGLIDEVGRLCDPVLGDHFRPPLVIHHISDVHVGPKSATVADRKDKSVTGGTLAAAGGAQWMRDDYALHVKNDARPHVIAVTGDLVEYGGVAEQLEQAASWLAGLHATVSSQQHPDLLADDPRVVIVGGNHDVNWQTSSADDEAGTRHEPFGAKFGAYPHPELQKPEGDRAGPFVHLRGCRVSFLLLGSAEFGGQLERSNGEHEKGEEWFDYLLRLLEAATDEKARKRLRKVLEELGVDVERVGERLQVQRVDPGFVSKGGLDRSVAARRETEPVRVAMLHHPLSALPAAPEVARYAGLTNAGQVKDVLFDLGMNLVLHGHQHRGFFAEERWPGRHGDRVVRIAAAPSLGSQERDESNGYNEIRLYREGDVLTAVEVRTFRFQGTVWRDEGRLMRFLVPGNKAGAWAVSVAIEGGNPV